MELDKLSVPKTSRKALKSSASLLGLTAGAVGWSSLAQATSEEPAAPLMFSPDDYEPLETGVVLFRLETGETLRLTADQYLILEGGLLLITDDLAQASIYSLSLSETGRAKLLPKLEHFARTDVKTAEATGAEDQSLLEPQAPRLSEQVEFQSYEIAQSMDTSNNGDLESLPLDLSWAVGGMVLMTVLDLGEPYEGEEASVEEEAAPLGQAPLIVEADWMALFGRDEAGTQPSADFDQSGSFVNANGVATLSEPTVWPYARATDADGDALVWTLTGARSSAYTDYDEDYDSPAEFLAAFDIFWNEAGSAYIIWSDDFATWYDGSDGVIAADTWTWDITVSDGTGLTDTASISLEFPPPP